MYLVKIIYIFFNFLYVLSIILTDTKPFLKPNISSISVAALCHDI